MSVKSRVSGEIMKLEKCRRDSALPLSRLTQGGRIPSLLSDWVPGCALSGSQDFPIMDCTLNFILIPSLFSQGSPMR